jgi:hypothetical protein
MSIRQIRFDFSPRMVLELQLHLTRCGVTRVAPAVGRVAGLRESLHTYES